MQPEPTAELSWIVWPAGAGWKQFALCTGDDPDFTVAVTSETAARLVDALVESHEAAEARGYQKAIDALRESGDFEFGLAADHLATREQP